MDASNVKLKQVWLAPKLTTYGTLKQLTRHTKKSGARDARGLNPGSTPGRLS
jgi:hypothetical protein